MANKAYISNGRLRRVDNNALISMRGQNVFCNNISLDNSHYQGMVAKGMNAVRHLPIWRDIEVSNNVFSTSAIQHVKDANTKANNNSMYVLLSFCITDGDPNHARYVPNYAVAGGGKWTSLAINGQNYIKRMVQEFQADSNVIMMEFMNEPDRFELASNKWRGDLLAQEQQTMLGWARSMDLGGDNLWNIQATYSQQDPLAAPSTWTNFSSITDWSDCVFQIHMYYAGNVGDGYYTGHGYADGRRDEEPTPSMWNGYRNGFAYPYSPSGYILSNKANLGLHYAPVQQFCQARGIPWLIGEIGAWNTTNRVQWMIDATDMARTNGCSGLFFWDYDSSWPAESYAHNTFTATDPGGGGVDTTPPAAPTGLTATAGTGQISLNWNNNVESDLGNPAYLVERSTSSGSGFSQIATATTSDYIDTSVTPGTTYYFRVKARDTSSNTSSASSEASAAATGATTSIFSDDFADGVPNTSGKWPNNTGNVTESGGAQTVVPDVNWPTARSQQVSLGAAAYVLFDIKTNPANGSANSVEARHRLYKEPEGAFVEFRKAGNTLQFVYKLAGGLENPTSIAFDATAHKYRRMRTSSGNLLWETSPDGATWTTRRTLAIPFTLTGVTVQHQCWAPSGEAAPGVSEIESVVVANTGATVQPTAKVRVGGVWVDGTRKIRVGGAWV